MRATAGSAWQADDGRTAAVLNEVFAWLEAQQLAAAGGVCRAWRRAAAAPPLWRRLLRRRLTTTAPVAPLPSPLPGGWRQEYVDAAAGWAPAGRAAAGGALHAALAPGGARLALAAEDASVQVWARGAAGWAPAPAGRVSLAARGWRGAVRALWSPASDRLLVLGALALANSWELVVLELDEEGSCRVSASARCGAGAGGCWADPAGGAFLSLERRAPAPLLALTTVWLNAASQETQSEYAGVRAPLLNIFNEAGTHITFAEVAHTPLESCGGATLGVLVTAGGARAGGALAAWPLPASEPPPVLALQLGDLRERVRRRAARPPPPAADPPPPDEATVRALCEPPAALCVLPAPPVGFLVHPDGRCVWAALSGGGAWCVGLPALHPLRRLLPDATPPAPSPPDLSLLHYVQPSISDSYFVSPSGAHSGRVCVWRVRSGAAARAPPAARAPALAALLAPAAPAASAAPVAPGAPAAPAADELLVLAGEHLYVWRSRSTPQPADESLRPARPGPARRGSARRGALDRAAAE